MNITLIGSGYVGLVTGVCFAEFGHTVTCVDVDREKIAALNAGECPIYEPGLKEMLAGNLAKERLVFTQELSGAVKNAEVVFIAVGTPTSRRGNGYADLTYVYEAARSIARASEKPGSRATEQPIHRVIVLKSTVPVGTARQVERIIKETNPKADCDVISNPEFLREGAAVQDFMHPDRVVLGTRTERAKRLI